MKRKGLVSSIVDNIINWPKLYIVASILLMLLVGLGSIKLTTNFTYRVWFQEANEKLKVFDAFEKRFGSDEISVVIVHSPSGIFDKESISLIKELTEDMWLTPEAIRVDSLTNFNWVHGDSDDIFVEPLIPDNEEITPELLNQRKTIALDHPMMKGYLINEKADVTAIYTTLKPSFDGSPEYENIVLDITERLKKYEGRGDHKIYFSGGPALTHAFKDSTETDLRNLTPIALFVTLVFLILNFKNASGVFLPLIVIVSTIACTLGSGGWVGIEINNITSVVPQFMIAIAISVAVHVLVNFFLLYNRGVDKIEAARASANKNFIPTFLTALSTSIGFLSFTTSPIPPISNMGGMAAMGTVFSWIFTYTLMLPILTLLPIKRRQNNQSQTKEVTVGPIAQRVTDFIERWRYFILATSSIMAVAAIILASQVEVNSDPYKYFDKEYPLSIATDFIEENLGGAGGSEIVINSGRSEGVKDPEFLKKVDEYQTWLSQQFKVTKTISIIDILKDMNKTLNGGKEEFYRLPDTQDMIAQQLFLYTMNLPQGMDINDKVSLDYDSMRLTAMWTIHDSSTALQQIKIYEDKARELGLDAYVTGKMPLYQSNNDIIVSSFQVSISLAIVLVGMLLIVGLRSLRMGLFSMIPNALPLIVGAGFVRLLNQPLDIGTVIVGSICLGIAVDDTIHFLSNFNRYVSEGSSVKEAIGKVLSSTAPALITTTMVLVATFGTFIFATFVPNQNFGIFVSIILTGALIIDLTFVPALLMTFQKGARP